MPSIVRDFSYDIFISYRQKDNQYDGWVSEFVNNLQRELAATVKENVSVYFDANPRDGLLETHQVDDSIQEKLKSLIFIPIVSRTYCDVKSYAWSKEFLPFLRQAGNDALGMKVRLSTGNVASRVIPVCIHEIAPADKALLENELGQVRSVDFIFTAPGVNRPLREQEERPFDNHKPLLYRNQINKLANAVGDIVLRLANSPPSEMVTPASTTFKVDVRKKSIAVLPFVNMSGDLEQEYFSDGISEEIINMLVKIQGLNVTGRTSSFTFKNRNEDLRTIAEKLDVDHVLEGSVRKFGNLIRVTAQLIEASTGFHLWSEKYDREMHDVFAIQDEIASVIADKLKVTLYDPIQKAIERTQTLDVEAYQLYLKGRALYYKRGIELFEARRCFEAALKIDSNYALAWAGLTDTYSMLCFHSFISPEEVWPRALHAAGRAIELGPDLAECHSALGTISLLYERDWGKAEREYLKAMQLRPGYLQARSWYSLFYLQGTQVNHPAAIEQAKISVESDPLSAYAYCILGMVSARAGDSNSVEAARKAVEFQPEAFLPWYTLGNCYHWFGHHKKATEAYNQALEVSGRHAWALNSLLVNLVEAQQWKEAESLYYELLLRSKTGHVQPSLLAMSSAAMGKSDEAMQYLQKAYERHDAFLVQCFNVWPDNKFLRAIPAYAAFLNQTEFGPSYAKSL